jgi:hypothetical protein
MPYLNREFDRRRKRALYAKKTKDVPMPIELQSKKRTVYQMKRRRVVPPCPHGSVTKRCIACRKVRYEREIHYNHARVLWSISQSRAKRKGVSFTISPEDVVIPTRCPILGIELDRRDRNHTPSLDRKIPALGYIPGNIFVISHRANRLKSDASPDELRAILRYTED